MNIGNKIKELRKQRGVTQEQLADSIGVSFQAVSKCENGACAMFGVDTSQLEASDVIGTQQTAAFDSVGLEYAKRISQLCKERGIKLILTLLPYAQCSEQAQMEYNYAASVLADEHVEYLNLLDMEGLDYATDFYNADHLNLAGGGKVTAYLAEHLRENYGIKDRREEAACAQMDETLAGYTAIRAGELRRETDLNNYLLRLHDTCFVFEAAGETAGGLNEVQMRLLEGAKERRIANAGQENAGEGGMMICTYDAVTREMVETVYVRDGVICR